MRDLFIWLKKDGDFKELGSWEEYCKALKNYPMMTGLVVVDGELTVNHCIREESYEVCEGQSFAGRLMRLWKRK